MTTVMRPSWSRSLRWIRTTPSVSGSNPLVCRQHVPLRPHPRHARPYAVKPIDAADEPEPTGSRTFTDPWPSRRKEPTDGLVGPESTSQSSAADLPATQSFPPPPSTTSPPKISRYELDPSPRWRGPTSPTTDSDGTRGASSLVYLTIDGISTPFDPIFLRDACPCPLCVDPSTSQKRFQTTDIPPDCSPTNIWPNPKDNSVTLRWTNDPIPGHTISTFPMHLLRRFNQSPSSMSDFSDHQPPTTHAYWTGLGATNRNPPSDYESLISSPRELQLALDRLQHRGMIFITGVPPSPDSISHIATRFGPLRNTFYGPTWDVRSVPSAKNVAYTAQSLALHMDLLYYSSPPSYQFLHCLANTASGGATLFADGFGAAAALRDSHPLLFDVLASFPVAFHYRNDNQRYLHSHPTIALHPSSGEIRAVNYSPPFQAPFAVHTAAGETGAAFPTFLEALRVFAQLLERNVYEKRPEPGECIVFDNRRVVHGRQAFDADGGDRWLRGAYVDADAVRSTERLLTERAREERWFAA